MHTLEPLVSEPSSVEIGIAIQKLNRYKSPGTDHIPAERIQAGGNTHYVLRATNLSITFGIEKHFQSSGRVIKQAAVIVEGYHC
jgi:hypothetical protein